MSFYCRFRDLTRLRMRPLSSPSLPLIQSYVLPRSAPTCLQVHILQGSVVDFHCPKAGAIVNAANEGCLGGGGVDGAINAAGGPALARDRMELPVLEISDVDCIIRCRTGRAVITGRPDNAEYGKLGVPFVIHAVGPNFWEYEEEADRDDASGNAPELLLRTAYESSLDVAAEHGISNVAFSLLSAGVFRGPVKSVDDILNISVEAIRSWQPQGLRSTIQDLPVQHVYLCGFTTKECNSLRNVCRKLLVPVDRHSEEKEESNDH